MKKILLIVEGKLNVLNVNSIEDLENYISDHKTCGFSLNKRQNGKIIQWKASKRIFGAEKIEISTEIEDPYLIYFTPCIDEFTMYEPFYGESHIAGMVIISKKEISEFKKKYKEEIEKGSKKNDFVFYNMILTKEEFNQGYHVIQL